MSSIKVASSMAWGIRLLFIPLCWSFFGRLIWLPSEAAGKVKEIFVPLFNSLWTDISPPCNSTNSRVTESPRPIPSLLSVSWEAPWLNAWKMVGRSLSEIPFPVSETVIFIISSSWWAVILISPVSVYFMALVKRLHRICCSLFSSAYTWEMVWGIRFTTKIFFCPTR